MSSLLQHSFEDDYYDTPVTVVIDYWDIPSRLIEEVRMIGPGGEIRLSDSEDQHYCDKFYEYWEDIDREEAATFDFPLTAEGDYRQESWESTIQFGPIVWVAFGMAALYGVIVWLVWG